MVTILQVFNGYHGIATIMELSNVFFSLDRELSYPTLGTAVASDIFFCVASSEVQTTVISLVVIYELYDRYKIVKDIMNRPEVDMILKVGKRLWNMSQERTAN